MQLICFRRFCSPVCLLTILCCLVTLVVVSHNATAQNASADDDREQLTAERFLQVLLKRPRPGTSLDRVYGYHVRSGSLEDLLKALANPQDARADNFNLQDADQGPSMMVLGLLQLQRGKSAAAVTALKKAEKLLQEDAACSYYLGKAHLAIGKTELAAAAMERAIERGPARNEALPIFTELGRIYGRAGAAEKALNVWNRLEKQFPGDSRVGGQIATTLADEGNVAEALKRFEALSKSARKDEDKIAFAIQAAEMKRRLGNPKEATTDLENILNKLRPGSWLYTDVRNRIEDGFLKSGDVDALADYYQNRLKNDADNLELMTRLGRILVSAGRLEEASTTLMAAVQRAPEDATVRLGLVDIFVRQSKITEAGQQYEQLAKQDPTNPDYLLKWGQLLLEDQKTELAKRRKSAAVIWQRLAEARSDDAVTLAQVADRLRSVDQSDEAIRLYRKAIQIDSAAPQYREYLGEYLHQLDRKDEAIQVWEAIADGDRRDVDSLIRLAEIFATFKLPERSLETWKAASEYDFTFSQELRYANQLRAAKQFDNALARLKVAETIAETPDERDQLLSERITSYSEAGTLPEKIAALEKVADLTTGQFKELALMHQAAGQLTDAFVAIKAALAKDPENIAVLSVAAEVLERQNRFSDAAEYYRKLANVDRRFQTNYLEKVAQLQVRLGLADDALKTSEELIQANPASTDTYLFAARTAFQLGRTDEGIEVLRRAMTVARRDNGPRKLLASEFAKQYRTDEAIDLYWQALDFESKLDNRIDIIRSLAPLYERRTEVETLLSRIEDLGAKDNDVRATQMMIAAANEAIQDYGSARQAIDRLLAMQPRNVDLLETMVRLCDAANELELAIEFQQRIVALADTPPNRFRLVNLQLDAGTIDIAAALSKQISMTKDPSRIMSMIQGAARRDDSKTAIMIARQALRTDDSLWDIKLALAQILLYQPKAGFGQDAADQDVTGATDVTESDAANGSAKSIHPWEQAIALCEQIRATKGPVDALPPTVSTSKRGTSSQNPSRRTLSPHQWGQSSYQIAETYQLGQYRQYNYGYQQGFRLIDSGDLGHAKILAKALSWVPKAKTLGPAELTKFLKQDFKPYILPKDLNQVTDVNVFWKAKALQEYAKRMVEKNVVLDPETRKHPGTRYTEVALRIFELDQKAGFQNVRSKLTKRLNHTTAFRKWQLATNNGSNPSDNKALKKPQKPIPDPLKKSQLDLLVSHYDQELAQIRQSTKRSETELLDFSIALRNELELAGQTDLAKNYGEILLPKDAAFHHIIAMIRFHMQAKNVDQADQLVGRLLPAVREANQQAARVQGLQSHYSNASIQVFLNGPSGSAFVKRNRLALLDAIIAAHRQNHALKVRRSTSVSVGTFSLHRNTQNRGYQSIEVKAPLSLELIDEALAQEILAMQDAISGQSKQSQAMKFDEDILQHLASPLPGAPVLEIKSRSTLAAFAYWWMDQPQQCYNILAGLSKQYPDDVNLRIEHARLASELGNDREALDILNSFEPLDSKMLVRKEMAALNLAVRISDSKRVSLAAERLFGMRMDTTTQLALSEQLSQLGMNNKAAAVLQRLRGGRKQNDSTSLQIAQSFMKAGDKEAAAEVAFQVLRSVNRSRNQQGNYEYHKRQAVDILKSADRLDPLIAMAKRRVDSAPKSVAARTELAALYTAAGKKEEADQLWAEITKDTSANPANPAQLITQANSLAQAGNNKEAVAMYLKAFQQQPQLLGNSYYELQRAAQQGNVWDEVYTGLLKVPANRIPEYRVRELIEGHYTARLATFSDAKMTFVIHVLDSATAQNSLDVILSRITDKQKEQYPQIRKSIIRIVTSDAAFRPTSQTWAIRSYNSNGVVTGGLKPVIEFIANDEEARHALDEAVEKQRSKTKTGEAYMARFLQALVNLKMGDKDQVVSTTNDVLAIVKELESSEARKIDPSNQSQWSGRLPEAFLWQAGNLMQTVDGIPNRPQLLITVYESAPVGQQQINGGDPRYSIISPLIEAYKDVGQPERAVQRLMEAYRNLDNSEQNQYNPGYGDYQDLETWKWIAEQLQSCNAPFQSLAIYRRALGDLSKFEKAKRWGGSQSPEPFQVGAKKAAASINEESAIQFLQSQLKLITAENSETKTLDLMMLPIASFEEAEVVPGFLMAINEAKKSEPGISSLKELAQALQKQAADENADWSLTAAQLMIAAAIDTEGIQGLSDQLLKLLPDLKQIKTKPTQQTPYLDCFAVGLALSQSDHADSKPIVQQIKSLLTAIVTERSDSVALLVLEERFGDPIKAIDRLLTALESDTEGSAPNKDQVDLALKIAMTSAKDQNWIASTRALKAALGQGPPLFGISTNTRGDAFAITNNRSSSNGNEPTDHGALLNTQVLDLVAVYEKHLQLEKQRSDSWRAANLSPQTQKDAEPIFDALLEIVIPRSKSSRVALYEHEIASSRNYDQFLNNREGIEPRSVAKTLVEVAALTNRFDDVTSRLSERITSESTASSTLRIQVALKMKQGAELAKAIDRFEALVNDVLPSADAQMVATNGSYSISSSMQTESFAKSRVLNQVMHAVWDVSQQRDLEDTPVNVSTDRILRRAMALIGSDQYTMQRHRQLLNVLQSRSAHQAAVKGDQSLLSSIIQGMSRSIASPYAGSNPEYMVQAQKRSLTAVLFPMIEAGNIAQSHGVIRQIIESESKARSNYKSAEAATVMRAICELPKNQQYDLLKKITFGSRKDSPILHWMGFVRASAVPELVRKQTPDFGKHKLLPLCSDVVPITDTALMLTQLAAELGKTDELLQQISEHGKRRPRTAKHLSMLAMIERGDQSDLDSLKESIQQLLKNLKDNEPKANDKSIKLPELEIVLATRALKAGLDPKTAEQLSDIIKWYSIRAQQNQMTAALGAGRAESGFGRTANGTAASPLKHFITMSVPRNGDPEFRNDRPLHSINNTGWVSSTGGYNANLLMLKYPVTGSFTMSADIQDGSMGGSDISYGGVLYQAAGWNKMSLVNTLRSGALVKVPVPNIQLESVNIEALKVTPEKIFGLCNDVSYLEDRSTSSHPWPAISQYSYRTSLWKNLRITGNPVIPRQVNLLDSTMRGWGSTNYSRTLPSPLLPTEEGKLRNAAAEDLEQNVYLFQEGSLNFDAAKLSGQFDHGDLLQYMRPLLDNEQVTWQFFWKNEISEIHPSVGRVNFVLTPKGTQAEYTAASNDLSTSTLVPFTDVDPPQPLLAPDVTPKNEQWNTITLTRQKNMIELQLNGQKIVELPVTNQTARIGFYREANKNCQIKDMVLTGDWPATLPEDLMQKVE